LLSEWFGDGLFEGCYYLRGNWSDDVMKRLCVSLPDLEVTRRVVSELHAQGIGPDRIHLLAREGVELDSIPDTTLIDASDFKPALQRGLAFGGSTGLLAGIVAIVLPGSGVILGGGAILLATTLIGALTGGYLTAMVGADIPNSRLHRFREALEEGEILLMFDVPKDGLNQARDWISRHHPEADILEVEPPAPILP